MGHPTNQSTKFVAELLAIFPLATYLERQNFHFSEIIKVCQHSRNVLLCKESRKKLNTMVFISPSLSQSASFNLSNIEFSEDKKMVVSLAKYPPEIILNNFSSHPDKRIGVLLASFFHSEHQYLTRDLITFHH